MRNWKLVSIAVGIVAVVVTAASVVPIPQPKSVPINAEEELTRLTLDGQNADPGAANGWESLVSLSAEVHQMRKDLEKREHDADETLKLTGREAEIEPWTYDIIGLWSCDQRTPRDDRLIAEYRDRIAAARIIERLTELRAFDMFVMDFDARLAQQIRLGAGAPSISDVRAPVASLGYAMIASTQRAIDAGDWDRALALIDDTLFLGGLLSHQADSVMWLTGRACSQTARQTVRRAIISDRDVPRSFILGARELFARSGMASTDRLIDAERISALESLDAMVEMEKQWGTTTITSLLMNRGLTVGRARELVQKRYEQAKSLWTMDARAAYKAEDQWARDADGLHGLRGLAIGSMGSVAHLLNSARVDAMHEDATRLVLAMALFAGDHGQPPATLEALVPEYIDALPPDPWASGGTYRYVASDTLAGIRLYSVGYDDQDNGGADVPDRASRALRPEGVGLDFHLLEPLCADAPAELTD